MFDLKNILGLAFLFAAILILEVDYLNYFKKYMLRIAYK